MKIEIEKLKADKQKLIDIMYEVAFMSRDYLSDKSNEEVAAYVSRQLKGCGFPTEPKGAKWGVLIKQ